jgi:hypothetical protein
MGCIVLTYNARRLREGDQKEEFASIISGFAAAESGSFR